jgi:protein-S-isoprenylcysteine O-methyltransferase Ste14
MHLNLQNLVILSGCLLIVIVWYVTNPYNFKDYLKKLISIRAVIIGSIYMLILIQTLNISDLKLPQSILYDIIYYPLLIVFFCAIYLSIWAKLTMKHSWGIPGQHDIKKQNTLITHGAYAILRNPIYLGLFFLFVSIELLLWSYFILLSIPIYLLIKKSVIKEEILLKKYFGKKYLSYIQKVPRFL